MKKCTGRKRKADSKVWDSKAQTETCATTLTDLESKRKKLVSRKGKEAEHKLTSSRGMQTSVGIGAVSSFENMGLRKELLQGIYGHGFKKPSAIQQRAIEAIISGKDVIAQAQSGTGKTATFAIGILQCLNLSQMEPQALVLSPTRELAQQSLQVMQSLGSYLPGFRCHACTGGSDMAVDRRRLQAGRGVGTSVHVVSGTPGRVCDLLRLGILQYKSVTQLVLDEADEMLNKGFKAQILEVVQRLPSCQVVLVSATLSPDVVAMTKQFMLNPARILVKRDELTLEGIRQYQVAVEQEDWKLDALIDMYSRAVILQAVVFCNTRQKVSWLTGRLQSSGFSVLSMHGDMEQKSRENVLARFRAGATRLLITTDVWARGLDVQQVALVINYDLPQTREIYLHRIGRCGRFGRRGVAVTLVRPQDRGALNAIEKHYCVKISALPKGVSSVLSAGP